MIFGGGNIAYGECARSAGDDYSVYIHYLRSDWCESMRNEKGQDITLDERCDVRVYCARRIHGDEMLQSTSVVDLLIFLMLNESQNLSTSRIMTWNDHDLSKHFSAFL